ncbi:unnamed protein product [Mucor hiemalis]
MNLKGNSHAYDILSNPEKRRNHDVKSSARPRTNPGGYNTNHAHRGNQNTRPREKTPPIPQPQPAPISKYVIEVTAAIKLKDIFNGAPEFNVSYNEQIDCKSCQGACASVKEQAM